MTSSLWRSGITFAFLGFLCTLPATVGAQAPPIYITQWGSGGSGNGQFAVPQGVATDAAGNVYVADGYNARIQKFTNTGTYITQWGTAGSGNGQFNYPWAVATDAAGNVYVADAQNDRVQKFTSTGTYITQWGGFRWPRGIATDAAGDVYVADTFNGRMQKFTGTGSFITQWGSYGSGNGEFSLPHAVATDAAGNVFVAEAEGPNQRVQKFTSTGTYISQWGSPGGGDGQFADPYGIGTDVDGNVYVPDTRNHRVQMFSNTGTYLTQWGSFGSGNGEFIYPVSVATDAAGNIYVLDQGNSRVQKFGPAPKPVAMGFDFKPNTLNLASRGRWVTGFLEPAPPHDASDIDISSILLNGTVPVDPAAPTAHEDHDGNGTPDLMVKFDRAAVELTLSEGDSVPVVVTGTLGGQHFESTDLIGVIRAGVLSPVAGNHLAPGTTKLVRWPTPNYGTTRPVALYHTLDGGNHWSLITGAQPNSGSYYWTVPNTPTYAAMVAVEIDDPEEAAYAGEGVLGVSETFTIDGTVGVGDVSAQFALRPITNPAQRELRVSFSLDNSDATTLMLFDVSGRQLEARRVDGMGPGWHSVTLGARSQLPAGVYVIRLVKEGRSLVARAALVP